MHNVSFPKRLEQTCVDTLTTYSCEKQLLVYTTLIAINVVFILSNVIAVAAFASLLPSFVVVLSVTSVILGLALLALGVKHIFAYPRKIKTVDFGKHNEYRSTIQKLLLEIQGLQNKVLDYKRGALEMKKEYDSLVQTCIEDKAAYIDSEETWRFENDELESCIDKLNERINDLQQINEDCENRLQEEQRMHFESMVAYETELYNVEVRLQESNNIIERQRLRIQEMNRKLIQSKTRSET
ncbi:MULTISPECIES: membrane protein [Chlamydia]|uniref:IncA family protein n=1 Tax=Chlamydophila parapsittaci TaxID=344886 RepID=A0ABX5VX80_9CHLA|nr:MULTISPECIES: membrane protein [Chlamydia]AFS20914.1 TMH-family membrane domain protein [Chlamydia psittaci GR9]QDE37002.1 hypothetical protein FI836_01555 [Chlamydophila parapsittaci]QHE18661.1 hypothetical protein GR632_01550 [Chlamydia psittaci]UOB76362.1 hypothetical protein MRE55_01585 [Chlamydia psittaci]USB81789.1 hypothetical protein NDK40_02475 [Chlamydia psittaci]